MIKVHTCFELWSPDDIDAGEPGERGFIEENEPYSFHDLVSMLKNGFRGGELSQSHNYDTGTWVTEISHNYRTGYETVNSIHYSRDNKPRKAKYWVKALLASGCIPSMKKVRNA